MGHEGAGHSLQATAFVNEAYLRLVDANDIEWHDRAHFLAVAVAGVGRRTDPISPLRLTLAATAPPTGF